MKEVVSLCLKMLYGFCDKEVTKRFGEEFAFYYGRW